MLLHEIGNTVLSKEIIKYKTGSKNYEKHLMFYQQIIHFCQNLTFWPWNDLELDLWVNFFRCEPKVLYNDKNIQSCT